jgi:hypothetical protein
MKVALMIGIHVVMIRAGEAERPDERFPRRAVQNDDDAV